MPLVIPESESTNQILVDAQEDIMRSYGRVSFDSKSCTWGLWWALPVASGGLTVRYSSIPAMYEDIKKVLLGSIHEIESES